MSQNFQKLVFFNEHVQIYFYMMPDIKNASEIKQNYISIYISKNVPIKST